MISTRFSIYLLSFRFPYHPFVGTSSQSLQYLSLFAIISPKHDVHDELGRAPKLRWLKLQVGRQSIYSLSDWSISSPFSSSKLREVPPEIFDVIFEDLTPRLPESCLDMDAMFNPSSRYAEWRSFFDRRTRLRQLCRVLRNTPLQPHVSRALHREVLVDGPKAMLLIERGIESGTFEGELVKKLHIGLINNKCGEDEPWWTRLAGHQNGHFYFLYQAYLERTKSQPDGSIMLLCPERLGIGHTLAESDADRAGIFQYAAVLLLYSMTNLQTLRMAYAFMFDLRERTARNLVEYYNRQDQTSELTDLEGFRE